jgi:hypothetical protein
MTKITSFDNQESKAFALMQKIKIKKEYEFVCKKIITLWFITLKLKGLLPIKHRKIPVSKKVEADRFKNKPIKDKVIRSKSLIDERTNKLEIDKINQKRNRSNSCSNFKSKQKKYKIIRKPKVFENNNNYSIIKSSMGYSFAELRIEPFYTKIVRRLLNFYDQRREIYKQYNKDSFAKDEDRLMDLDYLICEDLNSIKIELRSLVDFKSQISKQLVLQKKIIENLDNNISIYKNQLIIINIASSTTSMNYSLEVKRLRLWKKKINLSI